MRMTKEVFLIGLLTVSLLTNKPLFSSTIPFGKEEENPSFIVNSGEAEYNGQEISLTGDVVVQHALGKISAHHFTLSAPDNNKKYKFSYLTMQDKVLIEFQNGGQLSCDKAEVDYEKLQGMFLGSEEQPDVIYSISEKNAKDNQKMAPLVIRGRQMRIDFIRAIENNSSSKAELNQIQIDGQVRVNYNQDYLIQADKAFYQHNLLETKNLKAGTLLLSGNPGAFCETSNLLGDQILAKTITIDTKNQLFDLTEPHGILANRNRNQEQKLKFLADLMSWDNKELMLTLTGHVDVGDNNNLHLKTDHQLIITHRLVNGKKEIRTIECPQETEMTYFDAKELHKVTCHGALLIDQENSQIRMHSPKDEQGHVLTTRQVLFDDLMGEMCADQVQMIYEKHDQQFQPKQINLIGNVQIFNRFNGHVQESSSVLQYALADELEYLPESQDMLLTGKNGNRVLFFDKINSLQMSAPALKIHFDKTTHKESVQGIGDVRFTFIEREFNQLKERFRM